MTDTVTAELDAVVLRQRYEDACVALFEASEGWAVTWQRYETRRKASANPDCDRMRTRETGFCPCVTCNAEHDERMAWHRHEMDARDAAQAARKALDAARAAR